MPRPGGAARVGRMVESTPTAVPVLCLAIVSLGVYLFFTALALEWYPLLVVACACFVGAGLPAFKLIKPR